MNPEPPPIPARGDPPILAPPIIAAPPPLPSLPRATEPGIVELCVGLSILWACDLILGVGVGVGMVVSEQKLALEDVLHFELGPAAILITTLFSWAVTLGVCWFLLCRKFRRPVVEGFALHQVGASICGWSILLGLTGAVAATLLVAQFGQGDSMMAKLGSTPFGFVVLSFIAVGAPLVEEVYYRGFLLVLLQKYLKGWAVPLVAVWFAAVHVPQLIGDWVGIPVIFVMGFIWTWQRYKTGSLLPSIITHWLYNACQIAFSFLSGV